MVAVDENVAAEQLNAETAAVVAVVVASFLQAIKAAALSNPSEKINKRCCFMILDFDKLKDEVRYPASGNNCLHNKPTMTVVAVECKSDGRVW